MSMRDHITLGEQRGFVLPPWFLAIVAGGILTISGVAISTWAEVKHDTAAINDDLKPRVAALETIKMDQAAMRATLEALAKDQGDTNRKLDALIQGEIALMKSRSQHVE